MTKPDSLKGPWRPHIHDVDVLVLGAGLAGLRAALSAAKAAPRARVAVACPVSGPSGSSFANVNNALGVQVPASDAARRTFVREVLGLAPPGWADPALVHILARDGLDRFKDLTDMGLPFDTDHTGNVRPVNGCFSPEHNRAYIFKDLGLAFARFKAAVDAAGVEFLDGYAVGGIMVQPEAKGRAVGAWLAGRGPGRTLAVRARAVVAAMGGPSALYAWNMAAPGARGDAYGLLDQAGAAMANAGFLQFMWAEPRKRAFWGAHRLGLPGTGLGLPGGGEADLSGLRAHLAELGRNRATHCPAGYGFPDFELDAMLSAHLDRDGLARVFEPGRGWFEVAPMAHAGNGGAVIDGQGRTSVPGLYACGECATGMHGANRMGGASVTATQVFGHRAGVHAAIHAALEPGIAKADFLELAALAAPTGMRPRGDTEPVRLLKREMQRHAVLGGGPGLEALHLRLARLTARAGSWRFKLMARSALVVVWHLAALAHASRPRDSEITSAA